MRRRRHGNHQLPRLLLHHQGWFLLSEAPGNPPGGLRPRRGGLRLFAEPSSKGGAPFVASEDAQSPRRPPPPGGGGGGTRRRGPPLRRPHESRPRRTRRHLRPPLLGVPRPPRSRRRRRRRRQRGPSPRHPPELGQDRPRDHQKTPTAQRRPRRSRRRRTRRRPRLRLRRRRLVRRPAQRRPPPPQRRPPRPPRRRRLLLTARPHQVLTPPQQPPDPRLLNSKGNERSDPDPIGRSASRARIHDSINESTSPPRNETTSLRRRQRVIAYVLSCLSRSLLHDVIRLSSSLDE
mmetsp:Transcript_29073/g.93747  ORF Transcript_29073/g.93747 Transcript_29073/m.93747 type:complete len:291 (+) Transcript_29073:527-1399(+)